MDFILALSGPRLTMHMLLHKGFCLDKEEEKDETDGQTETITYLSLLHMCALG